MNKKVGAIDFFCIGFGAIVGVGWAVSINSWMNGSGGPLPAAVGYIAALVLMIPIALCYCELCSMLPVSGGGMAYAFRAFGDKVSFVSGWAAFGAFITIIPWEAIYVVDILSIIFPAVKSGSPLYTLAGSDIYPGHIIIGVGISIVLFMINRKGVSTSASLQRILCFILVGSGILAMIFAAFQIDFANFTPVYASTAGGSHHSFIGGTMSILASVPFFLAGFETIPQGIESAGGETKSIGKTVVLTVVLSCIFYALLLITLGGAMPWQEFVKFDSPSAARLFRHIYPGPIGMTLYLLILIGAISGLLTTWNGFMMASSQILMAMARVNIVPETFAHQHPKYKTPINALKVCLAASMLGPFLGSGLIGSLTTFSAAGYVLSWTITAFCLIKLRKKEPDIQRPYKIPGGTKMAWFSGLSMLTLFLLLFIPNQPVFIGGYASSLFIIWMLIGTALYMINVRERKQYSKLKRASFLYANITANTLEVNNFDWMDNDYQVVTFVVPKDADYKDQMMLELGWGVRYDLFVVKLERGLKPIVMPSGNDVIKAGDKVYAVGTLKAIEEFYYANLNGCMYQSIVPLKSFIEESSTLKCAAILVDINDSYCGKQIRYAGIPQNNQCMVLGVQRKDGAIDPADADTVLYADDILWVVGSDNGLDKLRVKLDKPKEAANS